MVLGEGDSALPEKSLDSTKRLGADSGAETGLDCCCKQPVRRIKTGTVCKIRKNKMDTAKHRKDRRKSVRIGLSRVKHNCYRFCRLSAGSVKRYELFW